VNSSHNILKVICDGLTDVLAGELVDETDAHQNGALLLLHRIQGNPGK
jgi:hypothetical protein